MRILVIAQTWEPEEGAPQRRWAWLTRALTNAGHHVHVLVPPPHYPTGRLLRTEHEFQTGSTAQGRNGEIIHRTAFREHTSSLQSRMRDEVTTLISQMRIGQALVSRWKPDLIIATAPALPTAIGARMLAHHSGAPYVLDLRDAWPDLLDYMNDWAPASDRPPASGQYKRRAFRFAAALGGRGFTRALHGASGVITTTAAFSEVLASRGIRRILTVRNLGALRGVSLHAPGAHDSFNILYTGTTGRAQELSNALRALARLHRKGIDGRMRVIGSGARLQALKDDARALGVPVEFRGRLPFDEVLPHYEWADTVLIHLQDWKPMEYTVPSKLYEALEVGRHITMSANGEAARIIEESGAGDTVPAMDGEALARLWEGLAVQRSRLDVAGRGAAWLRTHASPQESAREFVRFVEEVARGC